MCNVGKSQSSYLFIYWDRWKNIPRRNFGLMSFEFSLQIENKQKKIPSLKQNKLKQKTSLSKQWAFLSRKFCTLWRPKPYCLYDSQFPDQKTSHVTNHNVLFWRADIVNYGNISVKFKMMMTLSEVVVLYVNKYQYL